MFPVSFVVNNMRKTTPRYTLPALLPRQRHRGSYSAQA